MFCCWISVSVEERRSGVSYSYSYFHFADDWARIFNPALLQLWLENRLWQIIGIHEIFVGEFSFIIDFLSFKVFTMGIFWSLLNALETPIHYFVKEGNQACIFVFLFKLYFGVTNKHWEENVLLWIISTNKWRINEIIYYAFVISYKIIA